MANYKELSRRDWRCEDNPTLEQINFGVNQRIADSLETIAKDKFSLEQSNEYLRNRVKSLTAELEKQTRSANAYKGKFNSLNRKDGT